MRLHSDTITEADIHRAATGAAQAGHGEVTVDQLTRHGSRSRRQAWEVKLNGDGSVQRHRVNPGARSTDRYDLGYAATWDSWGWFLAHLYAVDPRMIVTGAYSDADAFHRLTLGDFEGNLTA